MNLEQLAATLPNGLHDAELRSFEMSYVTRRLTCELDIWIGNFEVDGARELYRPARLILDEVAYFAIEPPDDGTSRPVGAVTIDAGMGEPVQSTWRPPTQPPGMFRGYFYVGDINAFIYFAAEDVRLEWRGDVENRGTKV